MVALLTYLKQPNCIYMYAYLWLAVLAVVNAEEMLQPKTDETGTLSKDTLRRRVLKRREIGTSSGFEMAALGRPLYPGMLYDARKDSFSPGITLWDNNVLLEQLKPHPKAQTNLDFSSSDSLTSKFNLLGVSGSLKASVLGGLVEAGGSVNYLSDTKSSNKQSRVTMYYSQTTRYDVLTLSSLGPITYPEVFEKKSATHVVTAVTYGAQVFMVFDQTFSEEENEQQIEGELNAMVRKIPQYSLEGKTASQMTYAERNEAQKVHCKIYGDVHLEENPGTYIEALSLYKKLPNLLKENPQNAVPVKVWLYPLHLLNASAARLEREINPIVAFKLEEIINALGETERTYNDLSKNTMAKTFRDIKERLDSFHNSFTIYKEMLKNAVGRVLPAIRGGEKEEKSLEDILEIHRSSPFNADRLKQWLRDAQTEITLLSSQVKVLKGVRVEDSECRDTHGSTYYAVVICLAFTSLKYEDPYLSALKKFIKTDRFEESVMEPSVDYVTSKTKWFNDNENVARMTENTKFYQILTRADNALLRALALCLSFSFSVSRV